MALPGRALSAATVVAITALACGGTVVASATPAAVTCGAPAQPPRLGSDQLQGVSVVSACDAWAVGYRFAGLAGDVTIAEHWNGRRWKVVPTPNEPGATDSILVSVSAVSAIDVWAVGSTQNPYSTLIEHWNGSAWNIVAGASVPCTGCNANSALSSVAARSPADAWAVGSYTDGTADLTLIEHWNGSVWQQVPSPSPGVGVGGFPAVSRLSSVSAVSASNAWTVGSYDIPNVPYPGVAVDRTLILHWNGRVWSKVASPNRKTSGFDNNDLTGVSAHRGDAWAVGYYFNARAHAGRTLTEHWNGKKWTIVPSPNPPPAYYPAALLGVTTISGSSAWAVGWWFHPNGAQRTFLMHWNGRRWRQVASPNPGTQYNNELTAVAGTSCRNLWAVGYFTNEQQVTRSITARC
jgi:hypothetical protein